jgi:general secretion pathway protein G
LGNIDAATRFAVVSTWRDEGAEALSANPEPAMIGVAGGPQLPASHGDPSLLLVIGDSPVPRVVTLRRRGFTTVEMIVVLVIFGLIIALVAPRYLGQGSKPRSKVAQSQIEMLRKALGQYKLDVGGYPTTEQGLTALVSRPDGADRWLGPYLKDYEVPLDPWGRPFQYKSPGEHGDFDILSYGADGKPGGTGEDADVLSWDPTPAKPPAKSP